MNAVVLSEDQQATGASTNDIKLDPRFSNTVMLEVKAGAAGAPSSFALAPQVQVEQGGTWYSTYAENMADGTVVTSITTVGLYRLFTSGLEHARTNITSLPDGGLDISARGAIG